MARYVVRGGAAGIERHRLLAQCLWPTTQTLLRRARLRRGMRCLDVGCGIGDVTLRMAQWVGPAGHAVGLDSDAAFLAAARQEATQRQLPALFRQGRAEDLDDEAAYDLVYTRGLLAHVAETLRGSSSGWCGRPALGGALWQKSPIFAPGSAIQRLRRSSAVGS